MTTATLAAGPIAATSSAPSLPPAPLVVEGLALSFGGIQVLQNIALHLAPGEVTGLIGPNGAGKTSLFNCLTGLYSPQKGSIRLGDIQLAHTSPPERALLGFSRSFQHVALCPELSVIENVMVGLHRQTRAGWLDAFLSLPSGRAERARTRELAMTALTRLGIAHLAETSPDQLPPGVLRLYGLVVMLAGLVLLRIAAV